jgi:hypothetical protein
MDSQRLLHTAITLYESHRATVLGKRLGIAPFAVRVLDIVTCLPGTRIKDVEELLTTTRAKVISTVFDLVGKGLLTFIDPAFGIEDIQLYITQEAQVAGNTEILPAKEAVPAELEMALQAYQWKLLDHIAYWTDKHHSETLRRALTIGEHGD